MSLPSGHGSRRDRAAAIHAAFRPRGGGRGGRGRGRGDSAPRGKNTNGKRVSVIPCLFKYLTLPRDLPLDINGLITSNLGLFFSCEL